MEGREVNSSCRGFVMPVVGIYEIARQKVLLCPGQVHTNGLVFVLVTSILISTFVKQHSKSMDHQVFITSC